MALSDIDSALDFIIKKRKATALEVRRERKELRQIARDRKRELKDARTLERQLRTEKRSIRSAELAEKKERRAGRRETVAGQKEKRSVEKAAQGRTRFTQSQEDRIREAGERELKQSLALKKRTREGAKRKREGVKSAASLQKEFLPAGFATPAERQGEAALSQLLESFSAQLQPGSAEQLFEASTAGRRTTIPNPLVAALSEETGLNPFQISSVAPEGQTERLTSLLQKIVGQSSRQKTLDSLGSLGALFGGGGAQANPELETAQLEGLIPPEFRNNPEILALLQRLKLARSLGGVDLSTQTQAPVPDKGGSILDIFR